MLQGIKAERDAGVVLAFVNDGLAKLAQTGIVNRHFGYAEHPQN